MKGFAGLCAAKRFGLWGGLMIKQGIICFGLLASLICPGIVWGQSSGLADRVIQIQAESAAPPSSAFGSPSTTPDSSGATSGATSSSAMSQPASPFGSSGSQSFSSGLVRPSPQMYDAPNMFGDFFTSPGRLSFQSTQQLFLLDPAAQATLDPAQLALVQQQLSQSANQQALQQFSSVVTFDPAQLANIQDQLSSDATSQARLQITDQQAQGSGSVDANLVNITVTLPDLTNTVVPNANGFNINVVLPDLTNAIVNPTAQRALVSVQGSVDLQLAGGTRQTKIIENNHTLPQDRVYLLYNHFHNALITDEFLLPTRDANNITTNLGVIAQRRLQSVNRFTLGFEKTFESGQSSVEFRMPMIGTLQNNPAFDVFSQGGNVGNLS
ncbi:MAG: hypothetical protein KDA84_26225, partial [Planctomycetaceae bacterium]|nr:hypothetical protein [Planctomycetaceae bacterium]